MKLQHIEAVARAFYESQDDAGRWDFEPELIKARFLAYAEEALVMLQEYDRMVQLAGLEHDLVRSDIATSCRVNPRAKQHGREGAKTESAAEVDEHQLN
ncbi:hypothetical protein [Microvirga sp. VF16]|uniref:hypothetical protein n=1 Tax=Microvirga sp. VF16 TaxID=2807101 RepID=UPI00193CECEE|nr:hypothetical protein [Microvirga sp. VF16]QRM32471.1 hypothetical protein JO965_30720 [Microvirga sp. VF16]